MVNWLSGIKFVKDYLPDMLYKQFTSCFMFFECHEAIFWYVSGVGQKRDGDIWSLGQKLCVWVVVSFCIVWMRYITFLGGKKLQIVV
jgi:hypothetical protein